MLTRLIMAVVLAFAAASTHAQTTVALRTSARLADGAQEVRLSDIADLSGPEADALGAVVVVPAPETGRDGWLTVRISDVRAALGRVADINWGKVSLRGGDCTLRVRDPVAPAARTSTPVDRKGPDSKPQPVDMGGPATIRTTLAARLASAYGVTIDRLRLGFEPADDAVLDSLIAGRTIDIDPGASPGSARVPVTVGVYDGDRLVLSQTVQVDVRVNRPTVLAAATVERGRVIDADDVSVVEQWTSPSLTPAPSRDEVVGSVAQNRLAAGQPIGSDDVAPPVACKRGDMVFVHCLSGSVIVKMKARALAQARDGECVQLKVEGSDEPFTARMCGKGRAVLVATPAAAPPVTRASDSASETHRKNKKERRS